LDYRILNDIKPWTASIENPIKLNFWYIVITSDQGSVLIFRKSERNLVQFKSWLFLWAQLNWKCWFYMFILEFFKGRYSMRPKQISQFENSGFNSDQFFLWITNDKYTKFWSCNNFVLRAWFENLEDPEICWMCRPNMKFGDFVDYA
jgi:hypothetical protein